MLARIVVTGVPDAQIGQVRKQLPYCKLRFTRSRGLGFRKLPRDRVYRTRDLNDLVEAIHRVAEEGR